MIQYESGSSGVKGRLTTCTSRGIPGETAEEFTDPTPVARLRRHHHLMMSQAMGLQSRS